MMTPRTFVCVYLNIAALATLGLSADAAADEVLLVVPSGLENVEGDEVAFSDSPPPRGSRIQQVQPASDFSGLPPGHNTIVSMAWRPDFTVTSLNTTTLDLFEVRLSTTSAAPGTLSFTFADNTGNDETIVYSRPITLETDGTGGPAGGPRPFEYLIEFQTPFIYDPNQGNLLIDFTFFPPFPLNVQPPTIDAQTTSLIQSVINTNASSPKAQFQIDEVLVTQFAFVPEPSTFILAALGLVGLTNGRRFARIVDQ